MGADLDKDGVAKAYARWAPIYDFVFGAVFDRGRQASIAAAERIGGRILEVGVGTGLSLPDYSRSNRMIGVDLSAPMLRKAKERGMNVEGLAQRYAGVLNQSLEGKPADMVITTHVCRGNFRSTWIASGGYEPVAEVMLGGTNYDGYFLEYDTDRAGGLEPLRFLPKGNKIAVVGLVTSKSGTLEKKDDIKRRLDEAAKFAPLDQLALSPQCGFASTEEGNILTEDEQWKKLEFIVQIAKEVWGDN